MSIRQLTILVLVDTSTSWNSEVIRGIDEYAQARTRWLLGVETHGLQELAVPRHWNGDGIIARITDEPLARQLKRAGVPVVNVSWSKVPGYPFHQVTSDEMGIGKLAAQHLLNCGFRHFAYCGLSKQANYTDACGPAFIEALWQHGHRVQIFVPRKPFVPDWQAVTVPNLRVWIRSLKRPTGVLALGPEWGRKVTDACRVEGIRVPDEVGVITTEDDELMCEISHPTLSAVDERPRLMGYEAAALLDRMMSGQQPPRNPVLIPPQRVITRHSTDLVAIADPDVNAAVRFIRDRYLEPIDVPHILKVVAISRRILEQKFKLALGRSPAAEIRRVRLARAAELLATTDWPIWHVAKASGFAHVEGMNRVFQRELHLTPTRYRNQNKDIELRKL